MNTIPKQAMDLYAIGASVCTERGITHGYIRVESRGWKFDGKTWESGAALGTARVWLALSQDEAQELGLSKEFVANHGQVLLYAIR